MISKDQRAKMGRLLVHQIDTSCMAHMIQDKQQVRLTTKHYKAATIFIDHFSHLQYVHVMTSLTS
ncbi:hypothetical protein ACHAW6_007723 [Cyclotella cf. meneghiniana]